MIMIIEFIIITNMYESLLLFCCWLLWLLFIIEQVVIVCAELLQVDQVVAELILKKYLI